MATCHACGSTESERLLFEPERDLELNRCDSCRFVYLASWRESLASYDELYDYYDRIREEDLPRRHSPQNRLRHLQLLKKLSAHTGGRRLLDVGCGDGQLLETANEAGWDASGIDLSTAAIRLCKSRGLDAGETDFFSHSLDGHRFDVIVMSELIEHVPAPVRFFRRAVDLLEPRGVLYVTTPNFGSLSRRTLRERWSAIHREHIGYFERSTLRAMACDEAGLQEIKIEANNIAPSTLLAWARGPREATASGANHAHSGQRQDLDQRLRRTILAHPALDISKRLVNRVISGAGLGDTLVAWLQNPDREPEEHSWPH